jgi:hypothetical protein
LLPTVLGKRKPVIFNRLGMGGRFKGVGGRRGLVKKFEAPAAPMITSALLLSSGSQLFKKYQTENQTAKCKELKSKSVNN